MSIACASVLGGCSSTKHSETTAASLFSKTQGVIPFDNNLRRKWGSAVIADVDQNGWEDVITTQHGANALIYWNEGGTFSEPVVLIKGDTHGLGVSDFNGDGKINIVVAQGGGNGGNPRRPAYFSVSKNRVIEKLGTFDHFLPSRGRAIKFFDANNDAKLDLFVTGYAPKLVKSLTTNQLYLNSENEFSSPTTLTIPKDALSVKALTTDINNDGVTDVITFGGKDMTLSLGNGDGSYQDATAKVLGKLAKVSYVNNITEIDYDNDGDFDLFLNRSKYQFEEEAYYDPINKNLAFFAFNNKFMFDNISIEGDNLIIENIQETWATYNIQLGEKRTVIETEKKEHYTGGTLTIKPEQAQGWPEGKKLQGMHIGYLGDGKWRIGGYVKSRLSGVITNVTSIPKEIKRELLPARLLENRNGIFVDVTEAMKIAIPEQTTSAAAGDFNNDGFVDLAISPYGNMALPVEHYVLINNKGRGFSKHIDSGLTSENIGATGVGVTTFDYDHDGRLDIIFGNERGRWYFAENQLKGSNIGNHLTVVVEPSKNSHAQPVGARVILKACGKQQTKVVGSSGDGFHHMLKNRIHFGLGSCHNAEKVQITWPNGEHQSFTNIKAGRTISTQ